MVLSPGTRAGFPKTILFVDDEPSLLQARRLVFEALGYRVLTADSGERALELLHVNTVDAVIVDYLLPRMDGEETARRIHTARANVIIIILCSGGITVPLRVLEVVSAWVSKGRGPAAILEVLEQQLQLGPAHRTRRKAARHRNLVSS
ncbi:MAG TPA: response regulator [Terriglobales bacterium]